MQIHCHALFFTVSYSCKLLCVSILKKLYSKLFFLEENAVNKVQLQLLKPNVAVDQYGNRGHWTLIYNQGFEITVNQRIYFAFSSFAQVKHILCYKKYCCLFFFVSPRMVLKC